MAKRGKRVFILGGGAALGAHHVGAMKLLEEEGIKPDVIVASSIGVINACAYATGGVPLLEEAWNQFRSLPLIVSPSLRDNPIFGHSLFSADRIQRALEEYVDFPKIFDSSIDLEFILLNLSRGLGEMHGKRDCRDWRELRTIMRAGYAIPFLFPPVRHRGEFYADGGFAWNVPLDYALSLKPSEVWVLAPIASALPYKSRFGSFYDFASRVADVMWRTIGNMGYIYAPIEDGKVGGVPVTVIEPGEEWSGFGPLAVFQAHPAKSRKLMDAGYRDAKRALATRRRNERQGLHAHEPSSGVGSPGAQAVDAPHAVPSAPAKIVSIARNRR